MSLYNCKSDGDQYRISKFTNDLDVEASYLTSNDGCDCPAGHRPVCRHRQMLSRFIAKNATAGQWFHNYEANQWIRAAVDDVLDELDIADLPDGIEKDNHIASAASEVEDNLDHVMGADAASWADLEKNIPRPAINLLELAKPNYEGATTGRFTSSGHIEEVVPQPKPLRRL